MIKTHTKVALGVVIGVLSAPLYYQWTNRIVVETTLAKADADAYVRLQLANTLAETETVRATGLAVALKTAGDMRRSDAYLKYVFLTELQARREGAIYVPTEGGFPDLSTLPPVEIKYE